MPNLSYIDILHIFQTNHKILLAAQEAFRKLIKILEYSKTLYMELLKFNPLCISDGEAKQFIPESQMRIWQKNIKGSFKKLLFVDACSHGR